MTAVGEQTLWSELRRALDAPVRARLASAVLIAVVASAITALGPLALKSVIDQLASGGSEGGVLMAALLYVGALAVGRVSAILQAYLYATGSQAFQSRVSSRIFDRVLRLPLHEHIDKGAGTFSQTHGQAVQGVGLVTSIVCFTLLPVLVQITVILTIVGSLSEPSVWIVLASAIVAYTVVFALGVHRIATPSKRALDRQVEAGRWFSDALINAETVKGLGAESQVRARFDRHTSSAEISWRSCYALRTETGLLATAVFLATISAITWLAATAIQDGRMTIGAFVLLHAYALQIVGPLESTGSALRDLTEGISYLQGWRRLLRMPSEPDGAVPETQAGTGHNVIEFRDVSFSYEPGRRVLTKVSFAVPSGAVVAIVGASGAGKSSLLKLLQGFYAPDTGEITVNGAPIDGAGILNLRARIGVVSQDLVLFNDTLRFNLLIANPVCSDLRLREVLRIARLADLVAALPAGLDTIVGDRGLKLSGGERQRFALARALMRDPAILVLDEPTSALDPRTEREISADLLDASAGRTTLIVTHRLALAAQAQWIIALRDGKIVEQGSHRALLDQNGYYAELWRRQSGAPCDQAVSRAGEPGEAARS